MRQRTAVIVRSTTLGLGAGFILACVTIIRDHPMPAISVVIGQVVGSIVVATMIGAGIGAIRSRSFPDPTPPSPKPRPVGT